MDHREDYRVPGEGEWRADDAPQLEWSEDLRDEESELGFEGQVGFAQNQIGEECFFTYLSVIIFLKLVESLRSHFMLMKRQIHKPSAKGSRFLGLDPGKLYFKQLPR